jgi:LytR cell envelope-related transcriptional attenuator
VRSAVRAFLNPQTVKQPNSQIPTPKPHHHAFKPRLDPATVKISVLNGTPRSGLAATTAKRLAAWGYHTRGSNAPATGYHRTWVYYRPGFEKAAADLVKILGHGYGLAIPATFTQTANVVLILGSDYPGTLALTAPKSPKSPTLPAGVVKTESLLPYFHAAALHAHLPGLYPTVVASAASVCGLPNAADAYSSLPYGLCRFTATHPIRAYPIKSSTPNSLYAYFSAGIDGSYWGIQETRFVQAPILYNPSAVRHLDGRTYDFYFNGSHVHIVAIIDNIRHVAYWVQNTLMDDLSNADMIAIARSLKPTG